MRVIRKHTRDIIALAFIFVAAIAIGGVLLANQQVNLPGWIPVIGTDFFKLNAQFSSAQAVTPGQGQAVTIAGIKVGEVAKVELDGGRALVTMDIQQKYDDRIYANATLLLRPQTGLQDMVIQLDPGNSSAIQLRNNATIPIQNTLPNVNFDQVLATLDSDTRSYLQLLLGGGGQGLKDQGEILSADLRRLAPTMRDLRQITGKLSERRRNLASLIHNFRELSQAIAQKDKELAEVIDSSNVVFKTLAQQDRQLQASIDELPKTLRVTDRSLTQVNQLSKELANTLELLMPTAQQLAPALRALTPFFQQTDPVIKNQLIPFTQAALPTIRALQPAARNLSKISPNLTRVLEVVNVLLDELAFNPPGREEGFLFWLAWANHNANSLFSMQDAHGPVRHALLYVDCEGVKILDNLRGVNPQVDALLDLVNPPDKTQICSPSQLVETPIIAGAKTSSKKSESVK